MSCKNVSECKRCAFRSRHKLEFCDYLSKPIQVAQRECNVDPKSITVFQMKNFQTLKQERKLTKFNDRKKCKCTLCDFGDKKRKEWCMFYNKQRNIALEICTVNPKKITNKQEKMFLKKIEKYKSVISQLG